MRYKILNMNDNLLATMAATEQRIATHKAHKELLLHKVRQDVQQPSILFTAAATGFVVGLLTPHIDVKQTALRAISFTNLFDSIG